MNKAPGHVKAEDRKVYKLKERAEKLDKALREANARSENLKRDLLKSQELSMARGQRIIDLEQELSKLRSEKAEETSGHPPT